MIIDDSSSDNGKVEIINKTNLKDYFPYLEERLSKNHTLLIVGVFSVHYEGRASSNIGFGERILIIKKDKSVLIHQERGVSPINWQPPGNLIHAMMNNKKIVLKIIRRRPTEILFIQFNKIFLIACLRIQDTAEFIMDASEEQIQEAIIRKPDLLFKGFKPVISEKHIKPGFMDIYGFDVEGNPVIVELKRNPATKESIIQLKKYVDSYSSPVAGRNVRGIIAAPGISKSAELMLKKLGLEFKRIDPRECVEIVKRYKTSKLTDYFSTV